MKKLALTYLITGLAGFALTALPVQAKQTSRSKVSKNSVQVAAYSRTIAPADMDAFRNEHPEGGG